MADLNIAWMAFLAGIAVGLYFRVWMLPPAGLLVFGLALFLAQDGVPLNLMQFIRAAEVLVIFEIGYMLTILAIATDIASFVMDPRGSNSRRPRND